MKFVQENTTSLIIHSYDSGQIAIQGITAEHPAIDTGLIAEWDSDNHLGIIRRSIILETGGDIRSWAPDSTSAFSPADFLLLADKQPEIVLIGTGKTLVFPDNDCLAILQQQNIGHEIMDTAAACRTFNILASEERTVSLGLLMI